MSTPDQVLAAQLQLSSSPNDYQQALTAFYAACDLNASGLIEKEQPKLDCRSGCSYCCHLRVGVMAHEVLAIAEFIQRHFTPQQLISLRTRLEDHHRILKTITRQEHLTTNCQCPLLVDNRCSVYPIRPFACRGYHSSDVNSCLYSYENPTDTSEARDQDPRLTELWMAMQGAGHSVYLELGFDHSHYELGTALREALANSHSRRRWKNHTKAFPSCVTGAD